MESSKWLKIAIACLIGAVLTFVLGYAVSSDNTDISKYIAKTYKKANASGFASDQAVYSCSGEPKKVANDIVTKGPRRPDAQKEDPKTNIVYLRYPKNLVQVLTKNNQCLIVVESHKRLNNGTYVFMGPGFGPSSPGSSSGGRSGSGSGGGGGGSGSGVK